MSAVYYILAFAALVWSGLGLACILARGPDELPPRSAAE